MAVSALTALVTTGTQWAVTTAFTMAMAVKTFAISFALSAVSRALMPKPDLSSSTGLSTTVKSPTQPRPIIYGRTKTAGTLVYIQTTDTDGKYLHMVQAMAGHEIDAYEKIYIDDELAWENGTTVSKYASKVRFKVYKGDQTTADTDLVSESSEWNSNCVLNDTAYIDVRLEDDVELFPNGIPTISALIRGKKVHNPVTSVTEWSQNPALCIADYINDSKYGLSNIDIDQTALIASANVCDQQVDYQETGQPAGTHDRYQLNGYIDTSTKVSSNIENMLSAMFGEVVYSQGKLSINAGYYTNPVLDIDESMMVGDITLQTKQSRRSQYNAVKGVFLSSENGYVLADYPSQLSSSYALEDGEPIYLDMTLPFTTDNYRAQRLAKLALGKSRQQRVITVPVNLVGLKLKAGDNIRITSTKLGLSNAVYQVLDYELDYSDGLKVNLVCAETGASLYNWTLADQQDCSIASDVERYDGSALPPTNLNLTAGTTIKSDGTTATYIDASWTAPADVYFDYYEVTITPSGGSATSFTTKEPTHTFVNTEDDLIHVVSVRAYNSYGRASSAITAQVTTNIDTTAPSNITGITATGGLQSITLDWTNPSEDDFDLVRIKHNTVDEEPSSHSFEVRSDSFVHDIGAYSTTKHYWLAPVDRTGNVGSYVSGGSATTGSIAIGDVPAVAGTFYITIANDNEITDAKFLAAIGRNPIENDVVVLNKEYFFTRGASSWTEVAEFIDGSLLVSGSVNADRIEVDGTSASVTIDGDTGTPILVQSDGSTVFSVSDLGDVTMNGAYISGIPVTAIPTFESDVRAVVGAVVVDALVPATPVSYTEQDFPTNLLSSLKILDTGQSAYASDYSYNLVLRIDDSWTYEYTSEDDKQGGQDLYYFIDGYNSVTDVWETVLAEQTYTTPVFYKFPRGGNPQELYVIDITETVANIPSYYTGFRGWFRGVDKSQDHFANFEFEPYMTVKSGSSGFIPEDISVTSGTATGGGSLTYDNQGQFTFSPADVSSFVTQTDINNSISSLVDSAPATLDTLNELAAALGDDANFSITVTNSIATKASKAGDTFTGTVRSTKSTIGSIGGNATMANAGFLAGSTSNGVGIDGNEIVKVGGDKFYINQISNEPIEFHLGVSSSNSKRLSITTSGISVSGTIQASGYNNSNWDTAYGWGNHASAGYLTAGSSYDLTGDIRVTSGSLSFYGDVHMGFIPYPNGGQFRSDSGSLTGYIKISLPDGVDNSDDMISFWVDIFDYTTSESVSLFIGGYNYQSTGNYWVNCTAQVFTKSASKDYTVRFGFDGTRKFITIGETNSTWSHPSVVVRDFQTSFRGNVTQYRDDWIISTSTSAFSGIDETQTGNLPVSSSSKKWTTARTLSLTGDVTGSVSWDGSANASITATVANDSHTHDGRYYTESESDSRFVNVTGDTMTGNLHVRTGGSSGNFSVGRSDGQELSLYVDDRTAIIQHQQDESTGEHILQFDISSPTALANKKFNFTNGNIQVGGTTIIDSSRNLTNIGTISSSGNIDIGSGNVVVDNGRGFSNSGSWTRNQTPYGYIEFGPANTSFAHIYTDRPSFYFNKQLRVLGEQVFHGAYHPNADKWTSSRTITLSGDLTGSVSLDGSSNVTLSAQVVNNSHTHDEAGSIDIVDTRYEGARLPNDYADNRVTAEFTDDINGAWWSALTVKGWHDGYSPWQIVGHASTGLNESLYARFGNGGANTWTSLRKIFHDGQEIINTNHIKVDNNAWFWSRYSASHDWVRINANTSGGLDVYNQTDSAFANIRTGSYSIGSTTVIDSSRNLTNIGSISASGRLTITDDTGGNGSWTGGILIKNTGSAGEPAIAFQNSTMAGNYWIVGSNQDDELHFGYGTSFVDGISKVVVKTDGKVGINRGAGALSNHLEVGGSILATSNITAYSDRRLKDNIKTLDGSKVYEMRGVSFTKDGELGSGVIAQELEQVAPELVLTNSDEMKTKSVAYGNVVGYLIEAIKELKLEIEELKNGNNTN